MIGQQRDILAVLGIDIWIPKETVCQNRSATVIWRDQAEPEYSTEIVIESPQVSVPLLPDIIIDTDTLQSNQLETVFTLADVSKEKQQIEISAPVAELQSSSQTEPFQIQALALAHCILLIDSTHMTMQQQQLWQNIQHALKAEYAALQWPFPFIRFQDGRGIKSYVKGFLDSIGAGKKIILLGEHFYLQDIQILSLSSLQQMLENPLLKKNLWQSIQDVQLDTDEK